MVDDRGWNSLVDIRVCAALQSGGGSFGGDLADRYLRHCFRRAAGRIGRKAQRYGTERGTDDTTSGVTVAGSCGFVKARLW